MHCAKGDRCVRFSITKNVCCYMARFMINRIKNCINNKHITFPTNIHDVLDMDLWDLMFLIRCRTCFKFRGFYEPNFCTCTLLKECSEFSTIFLGHF